MNLTAFHYSSISRNWCRENVPDGRSLVQIMAPVRFMYEDNWHSGPECEKTGEYNEFKKQYAAFAY